MSKLCIHIYSNSATDLITPLISSSLRCGDKSCETDSIQLEKPVVITLEHDVSIVVGKTPCAVLICNYAHKNL